MVITRLTRNQLAGQPARGFESHRLRQLRKERKILYMNTDMKDKIKFCTAIGTLLIIIIIVLMIVLQYQVEGEKNMPYQLSKITIISTAEGEQNKGENTNVESGKTTEEQTTTDENAENVETENTNNAESTESAENSEKNNNESNKTSTEETHK